MQSTQWIRAVSDLQSKQRNRFAISLIDQQLLYEISLPSIRMIERSDEVGQRETIKARDRARL